MSRGYWVTETSAKRREEMQSRRREGATYSQIAVEFGISKQWAQQLLTSRPSRPSIAKLPCFTSERDLVERREARFRQLERDPAVLLYRAEKARRLKLRTPVLEECKQELAQAVARYQPKVGTKTKGDQRKQPHRRSA